MRKSENSRQFFRSLEGEALKNRSPIKKFADSLTAWCGSTNFLILNTILFITWIVWNMNIIPGIEPFDPYPFGFLTMAVSLEAIFLSIFVLITQNRSSYTSTIRDEVQLQVNLIAEQEITKVLQLLVEMRSEMGLKNEDAELQRMIKKINETQIQQQIASEIDSANVDLLRALKQDIPLIFRSKKEEKKV
jgi:uncharacterized membrane protein